MIHSGHKGAKRGMTLIELVIAMAIAGVVASAAFSLFLFGNKIFGLGNRQYNVQSNIRLAANQITDEIRYAVDIEILSDMDATALADPSVIPHYINYAYYDDVQKAIVILNRNESRTIPIQPGGQLQFKKAETEDSLALTITSTDDGQVFYVDSEIFCLNLDNGVISGVGGIDLPDTGTAIRYTTNLDFISSNEAPLATVAINTPTSIEIDYSKNIRPESAITLITSQGSLNASLTVSAGRIVITLPSNPPKNSVIVFNAGIYGLDPIAYSTYTYTLTYNNKSSTWSLSQS
ncbi:MAG: PilW family protein [Saccharofermentanales bacterium]